MKIKYFIYLSLSFILFCMVSACNTVSGVGKDVQAGGQALQKAADHHHNKPKRTYSSQRR